MDNLIFDWDDANIGHIADHEVTPEEAEHVVLDDPMELDYEVENGEERWNYVGETMAGRILRVSITLRGERVRVVTAFDPSPLQVRVYIKWKTAPL
jgi:uncharacterized DUF497 family protein